MLHGLLGALAMCVGSGVGHAVAVADDPGGKVVTASANVALNDGRPPTRTIAGHPALARAPRRTATARGHAGDPINVAFIGTEREFHHALARAGWYAADPITLATSVRIAADVVVNKPYPHAPVSDLYLWGRRQDLAFEQPHGGSPKQRHHVRFWRSAEVDADGEPLWLGAATFDEAVEVSRTTGGITHRIAPAVDRERNKLVADTHAAGVLDGYYWVGGFHAELRGTNGGGDPFHTDGRLAVGVITLAGPAAGEAGSR